MKLAGKKEADLLTTSGMILTYASLSDILVIDGQENIGTQLCLHRKTADEWHSRKKLITLEPRSSKVVPFIDSNPDGRTFKRDRTPCLSSTVVICWTSRTVNSQHQSGADYRCSECGLYAHTYSFTGSTHFSDLIHAYTLRVDSIQGSDGGGDSTKAAFQIAAWFRNLETHFRRW